ncbi:MAG: chromosomal replication initiator protein DnaA [Bauldia sp.]|nr:chromosomal replication initiator protein DnaA [Bauldia sp.]
MSKLAQRSQEPDEADAADGAAEEEDGGARKRNGRAEKGEARVQTEPSAENWARVRARLRSELGEDVFNSWFARVEFEQADRSTVQLSVPTRFLKSWITGHYRDRLLDLWHDEGHPAIRRVDLTVRSAARMPAAAVPEPIKQSAERPMPTMLPQAARLPAPPRPMPAPVSGPLGGSPVDPRFTFATFCEGAANRVALAAARVVAESGTRSVAPFNPLFIHSGVGRGKSHLLHAITQAARRSGAFSNVVYLTAEHFMFRFVAAIRSQSGIAFKESLRDIDLLLIDDVQFLQGKSTQAEFGHLLNVLIDGARQVVVAADRPPAELESLDERVRSRLGGGVAFEIGPPDLDLRRNILRSRFAVAKANLPHLDVPEPVLDYVAQTVVSNGRDLEGALNRLVVQWQFTNAPVTLASAEITLRDLVGVREPRRVRIEDIQKTVALHFSVSKADLLSSRRTRTIVRPRQIAMYLSKIMTPRSLPEIGRRFGGRDHTTVLHAVRKVEELMNANRQLSDEIEMLRRMIEDQPPS